MRFRNNAFLKLINNENDHLFTDGKEFNFKKVKVLNFFN